MADLPEDLLYQAQASTFRSPPRDRHSATFFSFAATSIRSFRRLGNSPSIRLPTFSLSRRTIISGYDRRTMKETTYRFGFIRW